MSIYRIGDSKQLYGSNDCVTFYPLGGGFCFTVKAGVEIKEVEYVPEYVSGFCYFGEEKENMVECVIDKNKYWNGWREPYLTEKNLRKLLSSETLKKKDGKYFVDCCGSVDEVELTDMGYHLNQGFTIEFTEKRSVE